MKKLFILMLSILLVAGFSFAPKLQETYAASLSSNSVIILSGKVNEENELVIDANLTANTGISGMTLEVSYNKEAMTLTNFKFGTALMSLEPITTDTNTENGYSITPFKINYLGKENDFTTGNLFTLTFKLSENIKDGNYKISLKYDKNKDVNYVENHDVKTKNLFIDNAEIDIKGRTVIEIKSVRDDGSSSKTWIIILCVSLVVVAGGIVVAIVLLKRKRNWKRL